MTEEILELMDKRKEAKGSDLYESLSKTVKMKFKEAKNKWIEDKCANLENTVHLSEKYSIVKELTGNKKSNKTSNCIKSKDGKLLFDKKEDLGRWTEYIGCLFEDDRVENPPMVSNLDGPPIIASEVQYALKKMKSGKPPGLDNISTEMLKAIEFIFRETSKYYGLNISGRKLKTIRYADDTVLLTENAEDLQLLAEAVNKHSNDAGLEMNVKKTKTMVITKFPPKATLIKIKETELECYHFKHLLLRKARVGRMFFLEVHMLAWCAMVVFISCSSVKGSPTITLLERKATTSCDNFQLAGQDYTQLKYHVTGANSAYKLGAFTAPVLIDLPLLNEVCSLLDSRTGNCTRTEECWGEEIRPGEYHLTYNKTADADTSNATVVMQWSGFGDPVRSDTYTFHEVFTAEISFIRFISTFKKSQEFLVAGEDSTVLEFDVYGIYNIPESGNAPQFYYVTSDGVEHKGCRSFDKDTGGCINQTRTNDRCSCRETTRCVYRISYTLPARQYVSNATVYLLWHGETDLRSDNFTLPQIRKLTEFRNKRQQTKSIVVGLWITFILLIVSTGVAVCLYFCLKGSHFFSRQSENNDG
ncbi:endonuclease-reverse transcriptase [Elysia marginata]|uniref:Endonuclease-reverse transcriptase n=1 Tax=Elysia marginata TaxID=1093978 RepID=A0AAV4I1X6_9GAST|nr:endonuclease-reverse transcriptase [Elysia marginata]